MALRLIGTALALLAIAACSKAPTAPATPAPAPIIQSAGFEGVWTVKFRIDECSGYRHCVDFKGWIETAYLHLSRVGDAYEGVADLSDHASVTGVVDTNGTLKLSGRRPAAQADDYELEVDAITLPQSGSGGTVRYTRRGPSNSSFFGTATKAGAITSIEHTETLPSASAFTGTWTGSFPIRTCESIGWTHCYPLWDDTTYLVTLSLKPGSSGVEGTLKLGGSTVSVSGAMTGNALRLSGTGLSLGSGVTTTYEVETGAVVSDRVGRLTGDVTLVARFDWKDGRGTWIVRYPPIPLYATARSLR